MSIESDLQKKGIDMLIDTNPTSITINRVTETMVDGARTRTSTTITGITIALYTKLPKGFEVVTDGVKMDRVEWSALAKSTADIKANGMVTDTFTVSGRGTFRVHTVIEVETHGVSTGKVILMELLK